MLLTSIIQFSFFFVIFCSVFNIIFITQAIGTRAKNDKSDFNNWGRKMFEEIEEKAEKCLHSFNSKHLQCNSKRKWENNNDSNDEVGGVRKDEKSSFLFSFLSNWAVVPRERCLLNRKHFFHFLFLLSWCCFWMNAQRTLKRMRLEWKFSIEKSFN